MWHGRRLRESSAAEGRGPLALKSRTPRALRDSATDEPYLRCCFFAGDGGGLNNARDVINITRVYPSPILPFFSSSPALQEELLRFVVRSVRFIFTPCARWHGASGNARRRRRTRPREENGLQTRLSGDERSGGLARSAGLHSWCRRVSPLNRAIGARRLRRRPKRAERE